MHGISPGPHKEIAKSEDIVTIGLASNQNPKVQNPSLSFGKIGQNTEPMSENARAVNDERHIPELKNRSTYFGSFLDFDQQNTESKIRTYPTFGLSLASKIQRAKYIWI